ncbi:RNA-binding S4 domain-containing protein [Mesorhizobium sp. Z1-4]|uniref:RNA-binding S4 domain-containing protein n=1 Tax=Mesorhizobium sp. Z1-4 TaxID=2448478 RepID=UPI000FD8CDD4|nr:RNA-binding S4 domain-containing protein [Mesorhizobium sp. Z1-4]
MNEALPGQRIDKWLYFARVVKTRTLATKLAQSGKVRINRQKTDNAARRVRPGDVLTISLRGRVLVLKLTAIGTRRGPASEAAALFEDLSPPRETLDAARSSAAAIPRDAKG